MTMKSLRYNMIRIRYINDGYIYVVISYEKDMKYVMVRDM